jgi:hypothetical protein
VSVVRVKRIEKIFAPLSLPLISSRVKLMMQFIKEIANGGPLREKERGFLLDIFNWSFLVSINNSNFN